MWEYKGKQITELPDDVFGFIYRISFSDGSYYIGKKQKEVIRRVPPLKGRVRKRVTRKENWQTYKSSSNKVKERLKNEDATFQILELCNTKSMLTYREVWWQFKMDVLADPLSLNENISGRFFK